MLTFEKIKNPQGHIRTDEFQGGDEIGIFYREESYHYPEVVEFLIDYIEKLEHTGDSESSDELISAQEARKRTSGLVSNKAKTQLKHIMDKIKEAIDKEQYVAYYYEHLMKSVEDKLSQLGYKIDSNYHRNELTVTISW